MKMERQTNAVLTTRCGCTRQMRLEFPPRDRIIVPLNRPMNVECNVYPPPTPAHYERVFLLRDWHVTPFGDAEAYYVEATPS